jgi:hypothetical protein
MHPAQPLENISVLAGRERCARPADVFRLCALIVLSAFICYASGLDEARFLEVDRLLEQQGTALALLECVLTLSAAAFLAWNIRSEKRVKVWLTGLVFTLVALTANMADYFGTLQASPDLALEVSPIWNGILRDTNFEFARVFGFWGKFSVSLLAGASLVFYLHNVRRLLPRKPQPLRSLLFHIGERCSTPGQRWLPFATVLAFYFAAVNLFCFYIAYANSLVNDLPALSQLPPLPAAVCIALALITLVFVLITHQILRCPANERWLQQGEDKAAA